MTRFVKAIAIVIINTLCRILPDDQLSRRLRPALYRVLGVRIAKRTLISGDVYVNGSHLSIGENSFVNRGVYFDLNAAVSIGSNVHIGNHVVFLTSGHEIGPADHRCGRLVGKKVRVDDGAWLGARALIMPGVTIGSGSIVGAGSVVTRDVGPNVIVVGNPARELRRLDD